MNLVKKGRNLIKYMLAYKQLLKKGCDYVANVNHQKLMNSLNQKWISKNCPMCGHNDWTVDDTIFTPMTFINNSISVGGKVLPLVAITCNKCGNTIFLNTKVLGCLDENDVNREDKINGSVDGK